jgi:nitrite reductase (NO-forming)
LLETAICIGLLLGFARRITYVVGALFSLLIWSTAEGFGGPYTSGATNIGPALVYALVFIAIASFERVTGSSPYSLDYYIERLFPGWGSWMELAPKRIWQRTLPALDLDHQLAVIGAVIVTGYCLGVATSLPRSLQGLKPTFDVFPTVSKIASN